MGARPLINLCLAILVAESVFFAAAAQTQFGPQRWWDRSYGAAVGDPQQGKRVAEAKCAACHGADGNSVDPKTPKLAGQNPSYLYWQLWTFKRGTRRSEIMLGIAETLSDGEMANATSFYSQQTIRPDPVANAPLAAVGQRIFAAGVGPGMMSSCAMCHGLAGPQGMMGHGMMSNGMMGHGMMGHGMQGMMGGGMMGNAAKLNGQHAAYIVDQLNRFADGERQGMMMNRIAASLDGTDRKAVAEFLSGSP